MSDLISGVRIEHGPKHAKIWVWNRGGLAGILVVNDEDALDIRARLLDHDPRKPRPAKQASSQTDHESRLQRAFGAGG